MSGKRRPPLGQIASNSTHFVSGQDLRQHRNRYRPMPPFMRKQLRHCRSEEPSDGDSSISRPPGERFREEVFAVRLTNTEQLRALMLSANYPQEPHALVSTGRPPPGCDAISAMSVSRISSSSAPVDFIARSASSSIRWISTSRSMLNLSAWKSVFRNG